MATWTKATLAARVLEHLGVVGENQAATAWQSNRVQEAIDSVYKRLRPEGLCPFALSAIPEESQLPLMKIVAAEVAPRFGYTGARLAEQIQLAMFGKKELADANAGYNPPIPVKSRYY